MTVEFVDTNVLIYAHSGDAGDKYNRAVDLLTRLAMSGTGGLSIQVFTEFYSVVTGKLKMKTSEAEGIIRDLAHWKLHRPGHNDILSSISLQQRHQLSWWDALILNSALELGATTLWTEDFSHEQKFGSLTVRNPFR